jgi:hypothetical protein
MSTVAYVKCDTDQEGRGSLTYLRSENGCERTAVSYTIYAYVDQHYQLHHTKK